MARILIRGGLGFVGSAIADACASRGDEVVSVDNLSTGKKEHGNPRVLNYEVDISDYDALAEIVAKTKPEVIFHCAALARIQPSFENPARYFAVNAVGTHNVLVAAKQYNVRRVVYSASSSAYGDQPTVPLHEDMKIAAQAAHPYGSTKRMGEMLMRDMGKATGGPQTVCLRYFNVYGPRQSTTADGPYATVIGIFLDLAKRGKPLSIVPDGHQRRDFTWVGDVVRANLAASTSPNVGSGEIINIGTGSNYSIWEIAALILGFPQETLSEVLLQSGKCSVAPARRGEVRETLADISRAKELLAWEPEMAFPEGIARLKT